MDDDEPPLIEVIGDEEDGLPAGREPNARWHTTIRTVAAVIGVVALLWLGSSVAGIRTTSDEQSCRFEVDNMRWMLEELAQRSGEIAQGGRGDLPPADVDLLVETARGCGADRYADLLERWYDDSDEDGDEDDRES